MANFTKTANVSVLAWQQVANGATLIGTISGLPTTALGLGLTVHLARQSGSAFTAGWPNLRVEVSSKLTGDDAWSPQGVFQPPVGSSPANTTLGGLVSAGATSFTVAAATGISAGTVLFLGDPSSANWELVRVKSIVSLTVTIEEPCTYGHASGAAVYGGFDIWSPALDMANYPRARLVVDNANSGQTIAVRSIAVYSESIG